MRISAHSSVAVIWLLTSLVWCDCKKINPRFATRSLWSFGRMIHDITGRFPLDFNAYGNYCGYGGDGEPVDDIDRCCYIHDHCYNKIFKDCDHDSTIYLLLETYEFTVENGTVQCNKVSNTGCGMKICACDADLSTCLLKHKSAYDESKKRFLL